MSDDATQQQQSGGSSGLKIPPELLEKYADLLELIKKSESMNDEERQYWIDILPIMTPEQITQLQGILKNERDQLAAIDEKYAAEIAKINAEQKPLQDIEESRRDKQQELAAREQEAREKEAQKAEDILNEIE